MSHTKIFYFWWDQGLKIMVLKTSRPAEITIEVNVGWKVEWWETPISRGSNKST